MKAKRTTNPGSDAYRPAEPIGAPSPKTGDAAWGLLPETPMADVAPAYYSRKNFPLEQRPGVEATVKRALVVAIDTAMVCARDRKTLFANAVFDALARIWSKRFHSARPARTSWDMTEDTVRKARREMLEIGVDLARIWAAIRDSVPGLYTVRSVGGPGHTRGRRVRMARGARKTWHEIIAGDTEYRSPRPRIRLLLARETTPKLKIAQGVAGERVYDRMDVGERTKRVIALLERTRLFLWVDAVKNDRDDLKRQVSAHPWRRMYRAWIKRAKRNISDPQTFQAERKRFTSQHQMEKREYLSLSGRESQVAAIWRQIRAHSRDIDADGFLEIKTAYYKTRNRRFQPRHVWPTEVSSKEDPPLIVEKDGRTIRAVFSPRGRWFAVRTFRERRPVVLGQLVGADASASMAQILAVVLGWREAERVLSAESFKDGLVEALPLVAAAEHSFVPPSGTSKQLRKGVGVLTNIPYGASYAAMAKKLRDDPAAYGENWGRAENLKAFIERGAAHDRRVKILADMRSEYLDTCRALVRVAASRDVYAGVTFTDPFDGVEVRWHPPGRRTRELGNQGLPLYVSEPVGVLRNGEYPVNYLGVEGPTWREQAPVEPEGIGALRVRSVSDPHP
jgi:hypothetical protein